jgi:hypothetical protein
MSSEEMQEQLDALLASSGRKIVKIWARNKPATTLVCIWISII